MLHENVDRSESGSCHGLYVAVRARTRARIRTPEIPPSHSPNPVDLSLNTRIFPVMHVVMGKRKNV